MFTRKIEPARGEVSSKSSSFSTFSKRAKIVWVWANTHGSFALGLLWLLARLGGQKLDREDASPRYVVGFAGGLVAAMVNPFGPRLLTFAATLESKRAIFIGYSMPEDDVEVIYLFKRGLAKLMPRAITIVEYTAGVATAAARKDSHVSSKPDGISRIDTDKRS